MRPGAARAPAAPARAAAAGRRRAGRRRPRASVLDADDRRARRRAPPRAARSRGTTSRVEPARARRPRRPRARRGTARSSPLERQLAERPRSRSSALAPGPGRSRRARRRRAPGRSPGPTLRRYAGARLTVIRRCGNSKPELRIAARTRSRASRTAVSASPTIVKAGRPARTSTSTATRRGSTPSMAKVVTRASTAATLGGACDGDTRCASHAIARSAPCRSAAATAPCANRREARGRAVTRAGLASPAMSTDPRQRLGRAGEELAAEHLERLGYDARRAQRPHPLRRARPRRRRRRRTLVFSRSRRAARAAPAAARATALHERKRAQVRRMAAAWLAERRTTARARPSCASTRSASSIDARGRLVAPRAPRGGVLMARRAATSASCW